MKRQIRLLVENLFDDDIFNDDINLDSEISDEYINNYKVGDIYYKDKKPYAICCGNKFDFNNKSSRFLLLKPFINFEFPKIMWSNDKKIVSKLSKNRCKRYWVYKKSDIQYIDENGYENTQIIKNNYNLSYFPAFKYCLSFGDNVYLPAIDELQILFINRQKLNNIDKKNYHAVGFWSSSQRSVNKAIAFTFSWGNSCCIFSDDKTSFSHTVFPFVKINN